MLPLATGTDERQLEAHRPPPHVGQPPSPPPPYANTSPPRVDEPRVDEPRTDRPRVDRPPPPHADQPPLHAALEQGDAVAIIASMLASNPAAAWQR